MNNNNSNNMNNINSNNMNNNNSNNMNNNNSNNMNNNNDCYDVVCVVLKKKGKFGALLLSFLSSRPNR